MAVRGIGVDVVDVERFAATLGRNPRLASALFTAGELAGAGGWQRPARSLAARFAAKEAVAKALGSPGGMRWHDCEVITAASGAPALAVRGTVAEVAAARGVTSWQLSMSHDGGVAIAFVIAEGEAR